MPHLSSELGCLATTLSSQHFCKEIFLTLSNFLFLLCSNSKWWPQCSVFTLPLTTGKGSKGSTPINGICLRWQVRAPALIIYSLSTVTHISIYSSMRSWNTQWSKEYQQSGDALTHTVDLYQHGGKKRHTNSHI